MQFEYAEHIFRTNFASEEERRLRVELARELGAEGFGVLMWAFLNNDPVLPEEQAANFLAAFAIMMPVCIHSIGGVVLYRARIGEFTQVADLSYPPSSTVTSFGRINVPNTSFFYGSTSQQGTLAEIGAKPGDIVSILVTEFKKIEVIQMGFEIGHYIGSHPNHLNHALKLRRKFFNESPNLQDYLQQELLSAFISRALTAPASATIYRITALIANYISHWLGHEADGYIYPAVRSTFDPHFIGVENINIALRPFSVDRLARYTEIRTAKVVEIKGKLDLILLSTNTAM